MYSSLNVGLAGTISSLSESDEPYIPRLLALRSACSARSWALTRCALSASLFFSIVLVDRRQIWHTDNGFLSFKTPALNFRQTSVTATTISGVDDHLFLPY